MKTSDKIKNVRDKTIGIIPLVILILILGFITAFSQTRSSDFSRRPNILFIEIDNFYPLIGAYGKDQIITPNLDRLAEMGQLFTRAYTVNPNCAPSRNSMLSGIYPSDTRWTAWDASQDKEVPGLVSLPMYLKNNGYKTVSLGKIYNNLGDGKGSWDVEWRAPAVMTEFWDYQSKRGIRIFRRRNKEYFRQPKLKGALHSNLPKRGPAFEHPKVKDDAYRPGRLATKAIEELEKFKNLQNPFFLAVGIRKPHLPFNAPFRYWEKYKKKDIKLPDNMHHPKNAPKISLSNGSEIRAYYGIPNEGPIPDSTARKLTHAFYASTTYMDHQVGRIIDALERFGLSKNTIVIFTTDHGFALGEHELWSKHTAYRKSVHIPLIMRVPGAKTGVTQRGLVSNIDYYPTICDLIGLPKPFQLQGKSFAKMIFKPGSTIRKAVFINESVGNGETIITNNYSYTEFYDSKGKKVAHMLYDLRQDPHENVNVAGKKKYEKVINKLSKRLHRHLKNRNIIRLP